MQDTLRDRVTTSLMEQNENLDALLAVVREMRLEMDTETAAGTLAQALLIRGPADTLLLAATAILRLTEQPEV